MSFLSRYIGRFLVITLCLGLSGVAQAHDPGLSSLDLKVVSGAIIAESTYARTDLETLIPIDTDADGKVTAAEFAAASPQLKSLTAHALQVRLDGRLIPALDVTVKLGVGNAVHLNASFSAARFKRLKIRSILISRLSRGHRQYCTLRDATGNLIAERMLSADDAELQASLAEGSTLGADSQSKPGPFLQFLMLGLQHILTGYDHLLFLFALLLVGGSLRAVAKIITSFTVAHSITLALATLNLIHIPAAIIEPMIAASIVFVGIENILRRDPEHLKRRWMLTFVFGLIHGCGFATALREMGIGSSGSAVAIPLLSFNLGVELGQIGAAALVLPLIWSLRKRPMFIARYVPACSLLITAAGAYWFIARTLLNR